MYEYCVGSFFFLRFGFGKQFVRKTRAYNIDEIDHWDQFYIPFGAKQKCDGSFVPFWFAKKITPNFTSKHNKKSLPTFTSYSSKISLNQLEQMLLVKRL